TIITTTANVDVFDLHDRMPVVIAPADRARWLDLSQAADTRQALLKPYDGRLLHHPVRTLVSNVRADGPALIERMPSVAENLPLAL
ncbi:MAG: putative SOS response-associated peptidase YedK, partial [Myxococcota bacterium]